MQPISVAGHGLHNTVSRGHRTPASQRGGTQQGYPFKHCQTWKWDRVGWATHARSPTKESGSVATVDRMLAHDK